MSDAIPKYHQFFNPLLEALGALGGSGTVDEIIERVVEQMKLPDPIAEAPHGESNLTEVAYRLSWARTYLKKVGLIENSERGVWSLTERGRATTRVDPADVRRKVRAQRKDMARRPASAAPEVPTEDAEVEHDSSWEQIALDALRAMDPIAFERLCQRLLRESGFIEVEVTKRSGDGGIDGRGVLRLNGLISFTVMFQSKRYADAVGAAVVRDFRGALMGRADKGLILTTGRFTHDAKKEATRDGATPIDLIDGELLVHKLKELKLGISTRMVEQVDVDAAWFARV